MRKNGQILSCRRDVAFGGKSVKVSQTVSLVSQIFGDFAGGFAYVGDFTDSFAAAFAYAADFASASQTISAISHIARISAISQTIAHVSQISEVSRTISHISAISWTMSHSLAI